MVFNDETTKDGLIQSCETWLFGNRYGSISDHDDLRHTFTRLLNRGQDKAQLEILKVDGNFQFHNHNLTTLPIDTADLVVGQNDYQMDNTHLKTLGVEVKDLNGNWYPLTQVDQQEIRRKGHAYAEFFDENGRPQFYDLIGHSYYLFPAPSADHVATGIASQSLKVFYQAETDYFVESDTVKTPGIPTPLHFIIPLFACQEYAKANTMTDKSRELDAEVESAKQELRYFIMKRNVDKKPRLQARYKSAL